MMGFFLATWTFAVLRLRLTVIGSSRPKGRDIFRDDNEFRDTKCTENTYWLYDFLNALEGELASFA